jgi:hypothetical protein
MDQPDALSMRKSSGQDTFASASMSKPPVAFEPNITLASQSILEETATPNKAATAVGVYD